MSDPDEAPASEGERSRPSVRHLIGTGPAAKKVAGARRHPSVVGREETSPHWLRVMAGWSWRMLLVVAAVALAFWAMSKILLVTVAVFLALVFTAVLRPLVLAMNRSMPRGLATALALVLSMATLLGLLTYVGLSVAGQWESLGEQFNDGVGTILDLLAASPLGITVTFQDVQGWVVSAQEWVAANSSTVASQALSSVGSVALVLSTLALATFCTVFFLSRGEEMWAWFLNQLPMRMRETWYTGGHAAWDTFSGYTRGTFIIAAVDAALAMVALLVLGVPLAAPLAVLVFIGAFIPLIGAPLAMVVAMIVALAANGVINALLVGVVIALIGQFEGHILQPMVMGRQVSLHPVAVALTVTAGTLIAGILGAVISVPIVAVAWAVFVRLRRLDPPTDFLGRLEEDREEEEEEGEDAGGEDAAADVAGLPQRARAGGQR